MSDIVWVACISAGGALVAAITSQWLGREAAAKQAARTAQLEALQWQRSEAKRLREQREAGLRELWAHVLRAQGLVRDAIDSHSAVQRLQGHTPDAAGSAASAAAQAYAVALLCLPGVLPLAKDFYQATAKADVMLRYEKELVSEVLSAWRESVNKLEQAVMDAAQVLQV